jgi:hypothetical protein
VIRRAEIADLRSALDRFAHERPEVGGVERLRETITTVLEEERAGRDIREVARADELSDLRHVPLGNALFTRDSFESEYGEPIRVGAPETVDLSGRDPASSCIYCDGERFTVETYATDRANIRLRFWWCADCRLGRAVSWGELDGDADDLGP